MPLVERFLPKIDKHQYMLVSVNIKFLEFLFISSGATLATIFLTHTYRQADREASIFQK